MLPTVFLPRFVCVYRVHFVLSAFSDIFGHMRKANFLPDDRLVEAYENYLLEDFDRSIISPLCRDVENDLRLHIHTKTLEHMAAINPKRINKKPLKPFLDLEPIRFITRRLNVKQRVRSGFCYVLSHHMSGHTVNCHP